MKHATKYPLEKIVVNSSFGRQAQAAEFGQKGLPEIRASLATITGQKPEDRPSKKSISGFKLREGTVIGLRVTLRRNRMMQFLNKVTNIVIPRIRDFKGIALSSVDAGGNLTFGIKEHIVFPEIVAENVHVEFGLQMTLVPRVRMTREKAIEFYRGLGIPLEKSQSTKDKLQKKK